MKLLPIADSSFRGHHRSHHCEIAIQTTTRTKRDAFQRPFGVVTLHHIASTGNVVLTERTERNENRDTGDTYTGKLMSTFEIEDRLIKRWAEYYDPAPYKFGSAVPLGHSGYKDKHTVH